jgi:hypothetical protein
MNAYQNFLDFFSMHNKERLDGLSECYFAPMTAHEQSMAFDYLLKIVEAGGSEETVHGLFMADASRAAPIVKELLTKESLREEAEIAAAWNLYWHDLDPSLLTVFIDSMSSNDSNSRAKAAYYVPAEFEPELISRLQGMVRTETDRMALIHATNKLLECYGITRESVDKEEFSKYYRGLRSGDQSIKEMTFRQLDIAYGNATA